MTYSITSASNEELSEAIIIAYERELRYRNIPNLSFLYETFCGEYLIQINTFLTSNADTFEITDAELMDLDENLEALGFNYPSIDEFKLLLDNCHFFYEWNGMFFNEGLCMVW